FYLKPDDVKEQGKQSVVDPISRCQTERRIAKTDRKVRVPERLESRAERRIYDDDRRHRHYKQKKSGRRAPADEIERCAVYAVAERTDQRFAKRLFVPRAFVKTAVDKERRRHAGTASDGASAVCLDFCFGILQVFAVVFGQTEFRRKLIKFTIGEI